MVESGEYTLIRSDGSPFIGDVGFGLIRDADGKPLCDYDGLDCTYDGCFTEIGCTQLVASGWVVADGECRTQGDNDPGPCKQVVDGYIIDAPDGTPCDDASACTNATHCAAGLCSGGQPVQCNDSDPTTTDTCSDLSGCLHDADCDELRVNLVTEGRQHGVRAISLPEGGVLAWQTGDANSSVRISFRLVDTTGSLAPEEIEVVPPTEVEVAYGAFAGFGGISRAGADRFVLTWNLGLAGAGFYQLFEPEGTAVTGRQQLEAPALPSEYADREILWSYPRLAHDPSAGFFAIWSTSLEGGGRVVQIERYNEDGERTQGPATIGDSSGVLVLGREDATFHTFTGGSGSFDVQRFNSSTLLPAGEPITVTTVTGNPHGLHDVHHSPDGFVVGAANAYDGAWLYWLDPNGLRVIIFAG